VLIMKHYWGDHQIKDHIKMQHRTHGKDEKRSFGGKLDGKRQVRGRRSRWTN
jgi:hypothetical protein